MDVDHGPAGALPRGLPLRESHDTKCPPGRTRRAPGSAGGPDKPHPCSSRCRLALATSTVSTGRTRARASPAAPVATSTATTGRPRRRAAAADPVRRNERRTPVRRNEQPSTTPRRAFRRGGFPVSL
jgi:hypothetical protein